MVFSYALDRKRHTVKGKANCESEDHTNYKSVPWDVICNDQSLLNIHFCQSWLELSPFWNWQNSEKVNLVGKFVSPYLIHFVGATKIWNADNGCLPGKYHATFSAYLAEQVSDTQSLMVFWNCFWRMHGVWIEHLGTFRPFRLLEVRPVIAISQFKSSETELSKQKKPPVIVW